MIFIWNKNALATITFTDGYWSTSFEGMNDWTHATTPTVLSNGMEARFNYCAGPCTEVAWGCDPPLNFPCDKTSNTATEQVLLSANNPDGVVGSAAQVHYFYTGADGNGSNNNITSGLTVVFPSKLQEFWLRFYVYYPVDINVSGWKILYYYVDDVGAFWAAQPYNSEFYGTYFSFGSSGIVLSDGYPASWMNDNNRQGYGNWIPMEIYLKNNTSGLNNGIHRVWRGDDLIINKTDINTGVNGISQIDIGSNGSDITGPANTVIGIRFDDIAVATADFSEFVQDSGGRNRIGLLKGDSISPDAPTNLSVF